jgi:hypothetical protein
MVEPAPTTWLTVVVRLFLSLPSFRIQLPRVGVVPVAGFASTSKAATVQRVLA